MNIKEYFFKSEARTRLEGSKTEKNSGLPVSWPVTDTQDHYHIAMACIPPATGRVRMVVWGDSKSKKSTDKK